MTALAPTLQAFFTDRMAGQRGASPNTVAAYRTTFRLLLPFAAGRAAKQPCDLDISDLDAPLVASFLEECHDGPGIEHQRKHGRRVEVPDHKTAEHEAAADEGRWHSDRPIDALHGTRVRVAACWARVRHRCGRRATLARAPGDGGRPCPARRRQGVGWRAVAPPSGPAGSDAELEEMVAGELDN